MEDYSEEVWMDVCVVWQSFLVWWYSVGGIGAWATPYSHYQAGCWVAGCIFSNPQSKCTHAKFCGRLCVCAHKNMAQCVNSGFLKSRRAWGWWNTFPRPDSNLNSNEPLLPLLASTQQAKISILIQCVPEWSYPEHFILNKQRLHDFTSCTHMIQCESGWGCELLPTNTLTSSLSVTWLISMNKNNVSLHWEKPLVSRNIRAVGEICQ